MEKVKFLQIFVLAIILNGNPVKSELGDDDCNCNTLDGDASNYLCTPVSEFAPVGTSEWTNQGSDLNTKLYSNLIVYFTGFDIDLKGDINYENGQSDDDVLDPVKKFFNRADPDIAAQVSIVLQFGRNDSIIRAHWVKVATDLALVNNAAASIVKIVKRFADVAKIRIFLLNIDVKNLVPASAFKKNPSVADQVILRNTLRFVFATNVLMKQKVSRVGVNIVDQCSQIKNEAFNHAFYAMKNAMLTCSNKSKYRTAYYTDGSYKTTATGYYPPNPALIEFCC